MMSYETAKTATLAQLTDELAAAGWDSTQANIDDAREAVRNLLAEAEMATATKTLLIRPDFEYNAQEFWDHFRREFTATAAACDYSYGAEVTIDEWNQIQGLPGFCGGPSYAPTALILVAE